MNRWVLLICGVVVLMGLAVAGGTLHGKAGKESWVFVTKIGDNGITYSTRCDVLGYFTISNMEPGYYAFTCNEVLRSPYVPYIEIVDGQTTEMVFTDYEKFSFSISDPAREFNGLIYGQTFLPPERGIIALVTAKMAPEGTKTLRIKEGGRNGTVIWESTASNPNGGGIIKAWRSHLDMLPVIPGKKYYFEVENYLNFYMWHTDHDEYLDGQMYVLGGGYNGWVPDRDLGLKIDCDDSDRVTDLSAGWYAQETSTGHPVGQTFVAVGDSLLLVWMRASASDYVDQFIFRVREGGPDGPQVGVAKIVPKTWEWYIGAAWHPDEVPLTPGQTYFLEVVPRYGMFGVSVYHSVSDIYSHGCLYVDGAPVPDKDLCVKIMSRAAPLPSVGVSNVQVTNITSTSATISWNTAVPTMTQVEYWTNDADHRNTELDETLTTTHVVNLTGLDAETTYFFTVKSYAEGYEYGKEQGSFSTTQGGIIAGQVVDEDGVPLEGVEVSTYDGEYSTLTNSQGYYTISSVNPGVYDVVAHKNLYVDKIAARVFIEAGETTTVNFALPIAIDQVFNGGFETGTIEDWTSYGTEGAVATGPWFASITPYEGDYFYGVAANGFAHGVGGLYQQVNAAAGKEYKFRAASAVYWMEGTEEDTKSRIGIDPAGGTDPSSPNIIWSDWDIQPTEIVWEWHILEVSAVAQSDKITLFVEYSQNTVPGNQWHINCFDGAELVVTETSQVADFVAGWNLMSLPVEPEDASAGDVLDKLAEQGNVIENSLYRFTGSTYEIYPGDFTALQVGRGYWLRLDVAGVAEDASGVKRDSARWLTLSAGWNLIGYQGSEPVALTDCVVSDGAIFKDIDDAPDWIDASFYYYEPGQGYKVATPSGGDDDSLRPWKGYWVYVYQDGLKLYIPAK